MLTIIIDAGDTMTKAVFPLIRLRSGCVPAAVRLHVAIGKKCMRLRASMCAAPQPDRIDGNTSIEMSGVRLLPGPQPERSRNAAVLMETQL